MTFTKSKKVDEEDIANKVKIFEGIVSIGS